jgi:hypothetical protein
VERKSSHEADRLAGCLFALLWLVYSLYCHRLDKQTNVESPEALDTLDIIQRTLVTSKHNIFELISSIGGLDCLVEACLCLIFLKLLLLFHNSLLDLLNHVRLFCLSDLLLS